MRILLIGINFGSYELKILNELRKQGNDVFYMYDSNPHYTLYLRIFGKKNAECLIERYQRKMLAKIKDGFDRVIVIVGRKLCPFFLEDIKKRNSTAKFILYLWDDVKRVENYEKTKHYYDEVYSFDLKDCKKYGFIHLPLFFTQEPVGKYKKEWDVYSAMFSHSEREQLVSSINKQAVDNGCKSKFYISLGRFLYLKRLKEIIKNNNPNIKYISKPITEERNYVNMEKSRTILDCPFKGQFGLTMRTIESLGMRNKLITTNKSIKYYDFYDENNISIITRDKPLLNVDFLKSSYHHIPHDILYKYSLKTWVKVITGVMDVPNYIGNNNILLLDFD